MSRSWASGMSRLRRIRTLAVCCEKRSRSSQRTRLGQIQEPAALPPAAIVDGHRHQAPRGQLRGVLVDRCRGGAGGGREHHRGTLALAPETLRQVDLRVALHRFAVELHLFCGDAVGSGSPGRLRRRTTAAKRTKAPLTGQKGAALSSRRLCSWRSTASLSLPHLHSRRWLRGNWRTQILQEPLRGEGRADVEAGVRVRLKVRQLRIDDGLRGDAAAVQIPGRLLRARRTTGQLVLLRGQKQDLRRLGNLIEGRAGADVAVAEVPEQDRSCS